MTSSISSVKEARELYELKEKAAKFYAENGVPQKMEDVLNSMFYENPADVYGHIADYFQGFAKAPVITKIQSSQGLDGKGQSTLQTEVYCTVNNKEKLISTSVCSNSTAQLLETAKPEDKEEEEKGREESFTAAVTLLNSDLNNRMVGLDPSQQREADAVVSKLIAELRSAEEEKLAKEAEDSDMPEGGGSPTEKKSGSALSKPKSGKKSKGAPSVPVIPDEPKERVVAGSMCMSAISQALCSAGATLDDTPLYKYIARLRTGQIPKQFCMPLPMVTIFQSGRAAPGKSNCVKEYMVVPKPGKPLKETVPQIMAIYNDIVKTILNKNGVAMKNVTDTGALMMSFDRPEQGLDLIQEAMTRLELTPGEDFYIALNLAGHEIFDYEKGKYEVVAGQQKNPEDVVEFWAELLARYPSVIAIIDPLRKQEAKPWMSLCERLCERCYILGEKVWHRPGLLKDEELTESFVTSGVVYQLEQMNTVSDIIDCATKMEANNNETVLSASIGETPDSFLADMAVGMNARFIKIGAPCRGERVSKLNRLLTIERHLQATDSLCYHGDFKYPVITVPPPPEGEEIEEPADTPKKESPKRK